MIALWVRGDARVLSKLKEIVPKLRRKVLSKAARTAMRPVLAAAKANSPHKTGSLRQSLRMRALKRNRRGRVGVRVGTSRQWFKGDEFYGAFQEFGWKSGKRMRKSQVDAGIQDNRKQIPGKHYVENAYLSHGQQALNSFMQSVTEQIDAITRGG